MSRADARSVASFFWRRVDRPGHDACRLVALGNGWQLSGVALFRDSRKVCCLRYEVSADAAFRTQHANVAGWVGSKDVEVHIRAAGGGRWRVDGVPSEDLSGCLDVDLGFTPATNLLAIRRLSLKVGDSADAPAAWLAFPALRVKRLEQHYRRTARNAYAYAAPSVGYAATLQVSRLGAVIDYPQLFEAIT